MMNVLAISLVLITLVTAGVFSPNPTDKKEDVIVKEGHRVVVVEYEPNDGNTKVSISPPETEHKAKADEVEDKTKENGGFHRLSAKELVCDAFGKCKHRIASALEGAKDTVSEKAHDAAEKMYEIEEEAKEAVGTAYERVKDTVAGKVHETSEKASELKEKAKESVGKKVEEVKEGAKETAEKVKGKAKDVSDMSKTLKGDVKRNASEDLDIIENAVKEDAQRLKVEGKRDYQEIRRLFSHVSEYIFSASNFRSFMGMIHLLGFALSYGVCVWMTFISSNILARALPKQQFAMVQSKIYPVYFKTLSYGIATAFLGHYLSQKHRYYANWTEKIQGLTFLALFSVTMFNSLFLEPRATKVMKEGIKLEKEEGKGKDVFDVEPSTSSVDAFKDPTGGKTTREPVEKQGELSEEATREKPQVERLSKRLKKLNVISSGLNALSLMGLTYQLVYLSQLVHASS